MLSGHKHKTHFTISNPELQFFFHFIELKFGFRRVQLKKNTVKMVIQPFTNKNNRFKKCRIAINFS